MRRTLRRLAMVSVVLLFAMTVPAFAVGSLVRVNDISFVDDLVGYIVGSDYSGSTPQSFVARTEDGGATWTPTLNPLRITTSVSSDASGTAYIIDDYFSKDRVSTFDGSLFGISAVVPPGGANVEIQEVVALAGETLAAVGVHWATASGDLGFVAVSPSRGASWTMAWEGPVYEPPNDTDPAPPSKAYLQAIDAAPGGMYAWAVGYETTPTTTGFAGLVAATRDGGVTWSRQTFPVPTRELIAVSAPSTSVVYIAARHAKPYKTLNGGATWALVSQPATTAAFTASAIDAIDATHLLVVSEEGRAAWSVNGGTSWTSRSLTSKALRSAVMVTASHWIVVGDDETILHTYNGGATWSGSSSLVGPVVSVSSPASGFVTFPGPIVFRGTATDSGVGVASVSYSVRRSDGKWWNGATWVSAATTLAAEAAPGRPVSWTATRLPDPAAIPVTQTVTLRAVATDALGTKGAAVTVTSALSKRPDVAVSTPAPGFDFSSAPVTISGTATGYAGQVVGVEVTIRRSDGLYWDGSAWRSVEASVAADLVPGMSVSWSATWTPDAGTLSAEQTVTVSVVARDEQGLVSDVISATSAAPPVLAVSLVVSAGPTSTVLSGIASVDGVAEPAARLLVRRRFPGSSVWATSTAERAAHPSGAYVIVTAPTTRATEYSVVFVRGVRAVASRPVTIRPPLTLSAPRVVTSVNGTVSVLGFSGVRHVPGGRVTIVRYRYDRYRAAVGLSPWVRVRDSSATLVGNAYRVSLPFTEGRWRIVAVHDDADHARSVSTTAEVSIVAAVR